MPKNAARNRKSTPDVAVETDRKSSEPRPMRRKAERASTPPAAGRPKGSLIRSNPDVCGGNPCIAGTRIPVWVLVRYREMGFSDSQLAEIYPHLEHIDLKEIWRYADLHEDEIQRQIAAHEG
ncbi:MAG TPA: DUF433 domain-containing protein [Planctomycetaceae bacterium]|nr:DUF433 domain-containing protein [Planctomycetaceae bacterium]